jgi:phosphomannomutase
MNLTAFKAYDIRGKYPEQVNEELAQAVGRGLVRYLGAKKIVVGVDMRSSSESLKEKIMEGLTAEGADVMDIGRCTTPMLSFAVIYYNYDGGIMISASHDPGDENGFKLIDATGVQIGEGFGLESIKKIVSQGFSARQITGTVVSKDVLSDYLAGMVRKFDEIGNLKVVVDYSNGVGAVSGHPLFARLSELELLELNLEPDGTFPNHPANPHDLDNFKQLQKSVCDSKADLGIFFDGDADRMQAVDEQGNIVPMDLLFCLLAERELRENPENKGQEFYYDLRFSRAVPKIIKDLGGKPVMMRVGNPFYKKALQGSGVMAAEFSGHVMFAENHNIDDGLFCALKVLHLLSDGGRPLSERIAEINKFFTSPELSQEAKNSQTLFDRVRAQFPEANEVELDGLYLEFPDGFISIRQSQTEPKYFRLRVEAPTKALMEARFNKVVQLIKA